MQLAGKDQCSISLDWPFASEPVQPQSWVYLQYIRSYHLISGVVASSGLSIRGNQTHDMHQGTETYVHGVFDLCACYCWFCRSLCTDVLVFSALVCVRACVSVLCVEYG